MPAGKCPVHHVGGEGPRIKDLFPNQLNVKILSQNNERVNPLDKGFNYREEVKKLDVAQLKKDIRALFRDSQDWWPADYGHYGPFFIRLSWHDAGTYRSFDGRGGASMGNQRFAPVNSWTDNGNLDKARRLLWPIKKKYGKQLSWADLLVFVGNEAIEDMGFKTMGFAFGREDVWEPPEDVNWGEELEFGTQDKRYGEDGNPETLHKPLGADQMGWIYVNPEGFGGDPDPAKSAKDIRTTFARMGMNDEETLALTVGGHTFGKVHGNGDMSKVGPPPEGAPIEMQGLGWKNDNGIGKAGDTVTSGLEGAWTQNPTKWDYDYLENIFKYDWELFESPAGSPQWRPKNGETEGTVPDAHDPNKKHQLFMMTTDLAFRADPEYKKIAQRFLDDYEVLDEAWRKAWYKLLHRDMGPHSRLIGPDVPEPQLWQDPIPPVDHPLIDDFDAAALKQKIIDESGLSTADLVTTAWASASTFRNSDKRGGANGARIRLEPQRSWEVNNPAKLSESLDALEKVRTSFNQGLPDGKKVSMADVIVLGGVAAVEAAARAGGFAATVPFVPGRADTTQDMTDVDQADTLKPMADGFRNYFTPGLGVTPEQFLIDRAQLLTLTAPELTVLVAGLRVLGVGASETSAFTDNVGVLSTDFFTNLFDMDIEWKQVGEDRYEGRSRSSGDLRWTGTRVDLVFGSNTILRAVGEVYAADDGKEKFVRDFCAAFSKVMHLDRFDLENAPTGGMQMEKKELVEAK